MAYIVYSNETITLKKRVKDLISELSKGYENVDVINLSSKNITEEELIYECNQLSLTSDLKVIVLSECDFLTKSRSKDKFVFSKKLLNYLLNENPNCYLIFTVENEIDEKNEIYKFIKENGFIYKTKEITNSDWPLIVNKYFENNNKKIAPDALKELIKRCEYNLTIFYNEAVKLVSYCNDEITINDVKLLISNPINNNVFDFINALLTGNKSLALSIFRDIKISTSTNAISLLNALSTNLILIERVLYLSTQGFNIDSIATKLNKKPIHVRIILGQNRKDRLPLIRNALTQLNELDRSIKHNEVDADYAFELFILNFKY